MDCGLCRDLASPSTTVRTYSVPTVGFSDPPCPPTVSYPQRETGFRGPRSGRGTVDRVPGTPRTSGEGFLFDDRSDQGKSETETPSPSRSCRCPSETPLPPREGRAHHGDRHPGPHLPRSRRLRRTSPDWGRTRTPPSGRYRRDVPVSVSSATTPTTVGARAGAVDTVDLRSGPLEACDGR